ncbi:HNH endonuclease [Tianweitania sediminis]|uniref:HNH endonuclease n=1 Tax=Tianweitania sediminis TaxID=1502156 RepID=A0A8J7R3Y8_9HYPH|nr:HNH endonuclease signature motif containing protein [Tianweitania sediminis]MBP0441362.1 HNH endonuclease [Tianweitania sediminis]
MARRKSFSNKDRARIFVAHDGICHLCGGHIQIGQAWDLEHVIAWELSRDDSDKNLRPAHRKCHKIKTHKHDRPAISKAKNLEAKHRGFFRSAKSIDSRGFQSTSDRSAPPNPLPRRHLFVRKSEDPPEMG